MFAASNARALSECAAFVTLAVFQDAEYGDDVSLASRTPSTRKSTRATPTSSDALAEIVAVPLTVAPAAGLVIDTEGGVVSDGGGGGGGDDVPP